MTEMAKVGIRAFRGNISAYIADVKAGATIALMSHGKAVAELKPVSDVPKRPAPIYGQLKGKMWIADDFDALDDAFLAAFDGDL
jgi:antitoxin (DNA-binding transcriptional repressor) of toxin-antitoxin stability system